VIEFGPRLISREDEDVSQAVADFLKEEGIDVRVDSKMVGVEKRGNSIVAKVESAGRISEIAGTHLLVATGRQPNTDDLGLDKAGIGKNARGYIQVDDQLRTNISGIWAMGDCNGRGAFTHTSYNDFEIVAANLLDNDQRRVSDRIMLAACATSRARCTVVMCFHSSVVLALPTCRYVSLYRLGRPPLGVAGAPALSNFDEAERTDLT
jgi:pyruvate/2-oxoglutarate dehydrogenase complex dihydrolipoamide dehydrogenase (E3) component